jgi:prepilin-type processing-associated H-X9-DG protein
MSYLPADTKALIAARPGILVQHRQFRDLVSRNTHPDLRKLFEAHFQEIDEFLVFWEGNSPIGPQQALVPPPSGGVLRMSKPQDWKHVLAQLGGPWQDIVLDGQLYYRAPQPSADAPCAFPPDDRTLVVAQEALLRELILDRNAATPNRVWDGAWKKVAKGQLTVALETRWLRRRITQGMPPSGPGGPRGGPPLLETISPLLERAQAYAVGIDASRGLTVDAVAATGSEQNTKPVSDTLQAVLTLSKNALSGLKREISGEPIGEAMDWVVTAGDSLLEKAQIDASGDFVHLHATSPIELAEGIRRLAPVATAAHDSARRAQSTNNLKQIGLAFHNYLAVNNQFPSPVLLGGSNKSVPYSWRVALLPYLEQNELYKKYNFDEPWDGPNNRKLIDKMPPTYAFPGSDGGQSNRSTTSYFVFTGNSAALSPGIRAGVTSGPGIEMITDGSSNTILVVEAIRDIPWTKPEDLPFSPNGPLPELGGFWPEGFNALFADGSVRALRKSIDPVVLKALITRSGGEAINSDAY